MILVTGGTGFIGKDLVKELAKKDDVRILSRKPLNGNYDFVKGDITDFETVKKATKDVDVVYHLAVHGDHLAPYTDLYKVNVLGTQNVIEAAIKNKVKKVVYTSSLATEVKVMTPYGISKREAEKKAKSFWDQIEIPMIKPPFVYSEEKLSILKSVNFFPMINKPISLHLVYKKALLSTFVSAAQRGKSKIYTVVDKGPISSHKLYSAIMEELDKKPTYIPHQLVNFGLGISYPIKYAFKLIHKKPPITPELIKNILQDRSFDSKLATKELGYKPVDTEETFRKIIRDFKGKTKEAA